jgi:hypothetical protein
MSKHGLLLAVVSGLCWSATAAAASVRVVNLDGPNAGFNDATPWTPRGGNSATTLGAARLAAFRHAAQIWGANLNSSVEIVVDAQMQVMGTCTNSGILGQAGTGTIHENFAGALFANTWYPQALANALAGTDLAPADADINATFNSDVDGPVCLGNVSWYYGFDAQPGSDIDFVTVVLHEMAHGLGFTTFMNVSTGAKPGGHDDAFLRLLELHGATPALYPAMDDNQRAAGNIGDPNLHWVGTQADSEGAALLSAGISGGHVRMHAPNPLRIGSSVSHFSSALTPNQIMEPNYGGPNHDPVFALALLLDIGWPTAPVEPASVSSGGLPARYGLGALLLLASALSFPPLRRRRR